MCIGLEKGTLKLIPFSKNWESFFNEEKHIFLNIIGDFILGIEHIGSTAIEGACIKPCDLKRELLEKYRNNRELYTESKTPFIEDIIKKALKERER